MCNSQFYKFVNLDESQSKANHNSSDSSPFLVSIELTTHEEDLMPGTHPLPKMLLKDLYAIWNEIKINGGEKGKRKICLWDCPPSQAFNAGHVVIMHFTCAATHDGHVECVIAAPTRVFLDLKHSRHSLVMLQLVQMAIPESSRAASEWDT